MGRVDNQDAFWTRMPLERARGITIFSKQAQMSLGDLQVTLLDTPGHVDFSAEMERTLQVLDYAILVISGRTVYRDIHRHCGGCWGGTGFPCFCSLTRWTRTDGQG